MKSGEHVLWEAHMRRVGVLSRSAQLTWVLERYTEHFREAAQKWATALQSVLGVLNEYSGSPE